jgi:hypothetical protein
MTGPSIPLRPRAAFRLSATRIAYGTSKIVTNDSSKAKLLEEGGKSSSSSSSEEEEENHVRRNASSTSLHNLEYTVEFEPCLTNQNQYRNGGNGSTSSIPHFTIKAQQPQQGKKSSTRAKLLRAKFVDSSSNLHHESMKKPVLTSRIWFRTVGQTQRCRKESRRQRSFIHQLSIINTMTSSFSSSYSSLNPETGTSSGLFDITNSNDNDHCRRYAMDKNEVNNFKCHVVEPDDGSRNDDGDEDDDEDDDASMTTPQHSSDCDKCVQFEPNTTTIPSVRDLTETIELSERYYALGQICQYELCHPQQALQCYYDAYHTAIKGCHELQQRQLQQLNDDNCRPHSTAVAITSCTHSNNCDTAAQSVFSSLMEEMKYHIQLTKECIGRIHFELGNIDEALKML